MDRCLDDFHHDCAVFRGKSSVEIAISVFEYSHCWTDCFLLGDLHFCSPILQPMEGEECTAKRRCYFIILRPLRPFINCIFAPAWSAEEDRNNGHMDEVLIVTAIRISWIQEVTQVQVNKQLLTILHSSCWATKFCPSSAPSSSLHTGHLDSSYLQPATINMKTS